MSSEFKQSANSVLTIKRMKEQGQKLSMVTCYDYSFARIVDQCQVDIVLVGDSVANVMLGHQHTTGTTMDEMVLHTRSVSRALTKPLLCADMPFMSYSVSTEQTLQNAARLIQEGGAQAVKLEGASQALCLTIEQVVESGVPVMGHLGLTPQKINTIGAYSVQGKGKEEQKKILNKAICLEKAGVFAIVLEMIPKDLAAEISSALSIPTIGIGAGPSCDGQVLVLQDLLGFNARFSPKYLKKYANLEEVITTAINHYSFDVKQGIFPAIENSFIGE